jgi:hypothetical protein
MDASNWDLSCWQPTALFRFAVRALRDVGDGDRNDLFDLC